MPVTYRVADEAARASALELLTDRFARIGYAGASAPPAGAHVLVAEDEGRVVATVSLVIEGDVAHLVRLASEARSPEVLVGLFDLAARHGLALGGAAWLEIEVQRHHAAFYLKHFGFAAGGEPFVHADGVTLQPMRIAVAEAVARLGRPLHRPVSLSQRRPLWSLRVNS